MAQVAARRVRAKLAAEPVEDLRIDFEDGYGGRADAEEDDVPPSAAALVAPTSRDGTAPPCVRHPGQVVRHGRPRERGIRTPGPLPHRAGRGAAEGFVITFPKVTDVEQVRGASGDVLDALEAANGALRFEIQVETPQAVVGPPTAARRCPRCIAAGRGRVTGLHFGTYDYTRGLRPRRGAPAPRRTPRATSPAACMQVAAAGTGVAAVDGSTNVLPVGDATCTRPGARTTGWCGGRWSTASTRAGTCTRRNW